MNEEVISKDTARRFLLLKQGLYGDYIFEKKTGAYEYICQAGCIQFDPVDSIGKNAELTLQSRVKGFRKKDLYKLLYKDRLLFDYLDKELSIIPIRDWPYFRRYRDICKENGKRFEGLQELEEEALTYIRRHGPVSSAGLPIEGDIYWHSSIHWSGNWEGKAKAARSVLEQLYTSGELMIHHKEGTRKYYDLAERCISEELLKAEDPLPELYDHHKWRLKRRIGAIGLLWNKNSTAFLGIGLDTARRMQIFEELEKDGEIVPVLIKGIASKFYLLKEDLELLEKAKDDSLISRRLEFMAPLDPLLWDRNLIDKIFDYKYSWEIYVPKEKRKYGYYVLPLLSGDRFIGRIEPVIRDGQLKVNGIWLEDKIRKTKKLEKAIRQRLIKFARFNNCEYRDSELWR